MSYCASRGNAARSYADRCGLLLSKQEILPVEISARGPPVDEVLIHVTPFPRGFVRCGDIQNVSYASALRPIPHPPTLELSP